MKKVILFGASVLLMMSSISCNDAVESRDEKIIQNAQQNSELDRLFIASKKIQKELSSNPNVVAKIRNGVKITSKGEVQYIDQETLDYLLDVADLSDLNISLNQVNDVISQNIAVQQMGYLETIENIEYSLEAKNYLQKIIIDKKAIDDIADKVEFINLSENEKQVVIKANETMAMYSQAEAGIMSDGFATGSILGNALGNLICGPACGLAGWLIGGIVGDMLK